MTATITLEPAAPSAGSKVTICLSGGTLPASGRVRFKIGGAWGDWIGLDWTADGGGCVVVSIPSNATQMQVEDASGQAPYRDVPV